MRAFLWIVLSGVLVIPLCLVGALFLVLQGQPHVQRTATFTPDNIERARNILKQNNPRRLKSGVLRAIAINETDVDLAVNYLANRYGRGSARVQLKEREAYVEASMHVPRLNRYVNIDAVLIETAGLPHFRRLRLGRLAIPAWVADWVLAWALTRWHETYDIPGDVIKQVRVTKHKLSILYTWQADFPAKFRAAVMPDEDQERLRAYHAKLAEVTRGLSPKRLSLTDLLPPLARLAQERASRADPVAENRAWILVLTFYINQRGLTSVVPASRAWSRLIPHTITLNGRTDFTKHFIISAALAAHAGGPFSDAVGLYKEIDDARTGSGFSFNDIAADRAGTRFGELAVSSKDSATRLQQRLSAGVVERDLMPATDDLPEFMREAEFLRRFGGIGAPAYQQMMANIEQRIAALPLFREP